MNASNRPIAPLALAREIASEGPDFQAVLGPGAGDRANLAFMRELREKARTQFKDDFCEKRLCGDAALAVDFFFPEERTIVEVALGLPNPASEFEKDIMKAVVAQDLGCKVGRLFFISRTGGAKKCS